MLIHAAEVAHQIQTAKRFHIHPHGYDVNFKNLVQRVSKEIDAESDSILPVYRENNNLDYYHGEARFVDEQTITVRNFRLRARQIYIASGARPFIPPISGLMNTPFLTSTEALRLEEQPKELVVLGGGYIATELAFYFAALGTKVHVVVRSSLIRHEDKQIQKAFDQGFRKHCQVYAAHKTKEVSFHDGTFEVQLEDQNGVKRTLQCDQLLVAAGIVPNSDTLNVNAACIETNSKGFIKVDEYLRTSNSRVWALGDVVGNYLFRHSVNLEGEYLFRTTIENPRNERIDYGAMPHAIFSSPQVAGVGFTEEQLQKQGINYVVGYRNYADSAMGMALRSEEGFVKLLVDSSSRKILGCHIIGHEASVLIHQIITLMQMKGSLDDLLATTFIHPALNEIVRNAARDARMKLDR